MTNLEGVEPFFLCTDRGQRFALYRRARGGTPRGALLYVHPFGDEMNKSRRAVAIQARAFADAGYAVLQVDLAGCGDSEGDFGDARWETWKRDLQCAGDWLAARVGDVPMHLWGLRLGAMLALACWHDTPHRYASALLWQPIVDGRAYMTQFLRVAVARHAMRGAGMRPTTDTMREALARGEVVEVAGYALASELVSAVDRENLAEWSVANARVYWLDVRTVGAQTPVATQRVLDAWHVRGVAVEHRAVAAENFWTSIEVIDSPALVAETTSIYASPDFSATGMSLSR